MWQVKLKALLPDGLVFGYRLVDEYGKVMDIVASELINKIERDIKVKDLTLEQVFYDVGCAYRIAITDGANYGIVNMRTRERKCLKKEDLVTSINSGEILLTNGYLRNNSNATVSIVCKNPEEIKRVDSLKVNSRGVLSDAITKPVNKVVANRINSSNKGGNMEHYTGELGDFYYDKTEFKIETRGRYNVYLKYIGNKTNGDEIEIPKGIVSCSYMFEGNTTIRKAPIIPYGVTNCICMFCGCTQLKDANNFIPNSVEYCGGMFKGCVSLTTPPIIAKGVKSGIEMFAGCKNLEKAPQLPQSIVNCTSMFLDCSTLKEAPEIPNSVTNCYNMFKSCFSLVSSPTIPGNVQNCDNMFDTCTSLVKPPIIESGVLSCNYMFRNCTSLIKCPTIPLTVTNYNDIVKGCHPNIKCWQM